MVCEDNPRSEIRKRGLRARFVMIARSEPNENLQGKMSGVTSRVCWELMDFRNESGYQIAVSIACSGKFWRKFEESFHFIIRGIIEAIGQELLKEKFNEK
ncbi:hypothetical protein TNCV_5078811 [Trichonephila clavipes]|nr:hypothetical protein TNCV_5078811 [Trichonephila clavipes]